MVKYMGWTRIRELRDHQFEAIVKTVAHSEDAIQKAAVNLAKLLHSSLSEPGMTFNRDVSNAYGGSVGTCNMCGKLIHAEDYKSHMPNCLKGFT